VLTKFVKKLFYLNIFDFESSRESMSFCSIQSHKRKHQFAISMGRTEMISKASETQNIQRGCGKNFRVN